MPKVNVPLANEILEGYQELTGFIYIYSGTVPATSSEALDMGAVHTELGMVSVNGDGTTEPVFAAPASGVVAKPPGDDWIAPLIFDGFADASTSLPPTFIRWGQVGDTCRTLNTSTPRAQFTASGPSGAGEAILLDTLTRDAGNTGSNTTPLQLARVTKNLG